MIQKTFVSYLTDSIIKNWDIKALADYKGESFTYSEVGIYVHKVHLLFNELGIKEGDKIGIVGKNSARWGILYIAIVTYGAVVVPILPDFKKDDLREIINHSDTILLFAGESNLANLDCPEVDKLQGVLKIEDFSLQKCIDDKLKTAWVKSGLGNPDDLSGFTSDDFKIADVSNEKLAVLSYTSGTTGFTKGVMLQHNSLAANIKYAQENMPLKPGDNIVSFLPLAHTFGCAFEFLFPFTLGCHITILTKTPSPQIIMKAFQEIKPSLILSVPLVIEKIYKNRLLPVLSKPHIKLLLSIPGLNKLILNKFRKSLTEVFGGNFHEIVMGGAPLNNEAEMFFRKMKFKYTLGYGMTECGPLISYHKWEGLPAGSSGKMVDTLEVKIEKESEDKLSGEICVRGENVMMGYYKNEEDTKKVMDEEGWLHTGDLGYLDADGFIHIKGRSKSMILGPSGKNIYPEEIESIMNNRHGVAESLIVDRDHKLTALVFPDADVVKREKLSEDDLMKLFEHHRKTINHKLPKYINISSVEIHPEEFDKTPKKSIKRYLYK
jgi:long-chain acyl-CoA synthetase